MSLQTVQFQTTQAKIPQFTQRIEDLFAGIHDARPPEIRYIAMLDSDTAVFTLILELPDGGDNPLPSIPAAASFREWLAGHTDDDVTPHPCTVVGRYSA